MTAPAGRAPTPEQVGAARSRLTTMVFASRRGGPPHVVSRVLEGGDGRWRCGTCAAVLNLDERPAGCWAMRAAAAIVG